MTHKLTNQDNPSIVEARPEDLDAILGIMQQANQYAFSKSSDLVWVSPHGKDALTLQLEQGECFVIRNPDESIAAVVTIDEEDSYTWGDEGSDGTALYFHKLMKNPQHSQLNSGLKLLHFTAQEALRRGKSIIRCDTKPTMTRLVAYYENLGFIKQRNVIYKHSGLEGILLQADARQVLERTTQLS